MPSQQSNNIIKILVTPPSAIKLLVQQLAPIKVLKIGNIINFNTYTGGGSNSIYNETPAGEIDNVNMMFVTANEFKTNSTAVYINGIRQTLNISYVEQLNNKIVFDWAPWPAVELRIDYTLK